MFIQGRKQPLQPHSDFWELRLNFQPHKVKGETEAEVIHFVVVNETM